MEKLLLAASLLVANRERELRRAIEANTAPSGGLTLQKAFVLGRVGYKGYENNLAFF